MPQLTDQQILDLFQLKSMPGVSTVNISVHPGDYCSVGVHGAVDADMMPVVKAVERITGVKIRLSPIRDEGNAKTVQWLKHDSRILSVTIYSVQTFDDAA